MEENTKYVIEERRWLCVVLAAVFVLKSLWVVAQRFVFAPDAGVAEFYSAAAAGYIAAAVFAVLESLLMLACANYSSGKIRTAFFLGAAGSICPAIYKVFCYAAGLDIAAASIVGLFFRIIGGALLLIMFAVFFFNRKNPPSVRVPAIISALMCVLYSAVQTVIYKMIFDTNMGIRIIESAREVKIINAMSITFEIPFYVITALMFVFLYNTAHED